MTMPRRSDFAPSLKQVMRQYSPEYLMRKHSPARLLKHGRTSTEDYDKQFEKEHREQVEEVRKALHIGKKLYRKAKKTFPGFTEETEGVLEAGDRVLNVAGQMVGISGLSPLPADPTGFLAECEEAILAEISEYVVKEGLLRGNETNR
jgi:hypothetical protein